MGINKQRSYGSRENLWVAISEIDTLKEKEVDLKVLAENGVKIFFTQVFEQNFFHADMHPGNIFVDPTDPKRPRYMGIDCAIMGTLSDLIDTTLQGIYLQFLKEIII